MAERNSFVMYMSWATLLANLPEEQAGVLIKAICAKQTGTEYEITDPTIKAMFAMIESQLDKDTAKYNETCRSRAEAGRKGNEKRWTESQTVTKYRNCDICDKPESQTVTNVADNEYESESDNESESDSENEKDNEHPTGAKKKKSAQARPVRHKHGEFGHVLLTDDDLARLNDKHGEDATQAAIRAVDEYCEQSGRTYKNYALVMEKWGYRSAAENARSGTQKKQGGYVDAINHRFDAVGDWLEASNDTR